MLGSSGNPLARAQKSPTIRGSLQLGCSSLEVSVCSLSLTELPVPSLQTEKSPQPFLAEKSPSPSSWKQRQHTDTYTQRQQTHAHTLSPFSALGLKGTHCNCHDHDHLGVYQGAPHYPSWSGGSFVPLLASAVHVTAELQTPSQASDSTTQSIRNVAPHRGCCLYPFPTGH